MDATKAQLTTRLNQIYDAYRTACLNYKYYSCRVVRYSRWNNIYEVVLALGTSGTIAGWAIWKSPLGQNVWTFFVGAIAILVILKPFLKLSQNVELYSKLYSGYKGLYYDLKESVDDIHLQKQISEEIAKSFDTARKRYRDFALQDEVKPRKRLLRHCFDEVKREIPVDDLWYPE